jgi:nitroimidazol reductase NimA-like FMN-containing flavoprotein (pyridoxamine 5'-phosphate oxidase superfamily)
MQHRREPEDAEDDAVVGDPNGSESRDEGLVEIPLETCERLLEEGAVGLLALAAGDAAPDVRPVNFVLDDRRVVMRTGRGRIYQGACRGEAASFVITQSDRLEHSGWSVVVSGRLSLCEDDEALLKARVRPWARADKREVVALSMDRISGRRLSRRAQR